MAVLRFKTTTKNNVLTQVKNDIDAGSGPGIQRIYTGAMPATVETAETGTLLAELTLSDPCGTVADGALTFAAITQDASANADGVAGYVRTYDSDGNAVFDGDVSNTGGTGFLKMNTVNIVAGGPVQISSAVLRVG